MMQNTSSLALVFVLQHSQTQLANAEGLLHKNHVNLQLFKVLVVSAIFKAALAFLREWSILKTIKPSKQLVLVTCSTDISAIDQTEICSLVVFGQIVTGTIVLTLIRNRRTEMLAIAVTFLMKILAPFFKKSIQPVLVVGVQKSAVAHLTRRTPIANVKRTTIMEMLAIALLDASFVLQRAPCKMVVSKTQVLVLATALTGILVRNSLLVYLPMATTIKVATSAKNSTFACRSNSNATALHLALRLL